MNPYKKRVCSRERTESEKILGLQTLTKSNLDMLGLLRTKASPILKQSKKTSSRSIAGHGENGMARGEATPAEAAGSLQTCVGRLGLGRPAGHRDCQ